MKTQLFSIEIYYNRTGRHKKGTVKQYGHSVCSIETAEHTVDRQTVTVTVTKTVSFSWDCSVDCIHVEFC
jgi:hypothetical protein